MPDEQSNFSNDYDWRITDAQRSMISDKVPKLSKKEAGLLISFIQHCIFERRASEVNKLGESG